MILRRCFSVTQPVMQNQKVFRLPEFLEFYRPVVESTQHIIERFVDLTGLPWWLSISLLTLGVRTLNLPLLIKQYRSLTPLAKAMPSYRLAGEIIKHAEVSNFTKISAWYTTSRQINKFYKTKFYKAFIYAILQIPQFITFVWSVRSLCVTNSELITGGTGWFVDLTVPDPFMILPIFAIGVSYLNLQRGITPENKNWLINRLKYYIQMWLIITLPFTVQWPAV